MNNKVETSLKKIPEIKGTVSVISSDPSCKDNNVRFTMEFLYALSDQVRIRHPCSSFFKLFIFICDFSATLTCVFFAYPNQLRKSQK